MSKLRRRQPPPYRGFSSESPVDTKSRLVQDQNSTAQTINIGGKSDGSGSRGSEGRWLKTLGYWFLALMFTSFGALVATFLCQSEPDDLSQPPPPDIVEGGACKNWNQYQNGQACERAEQTELAFGLSLYWLRRGDASMAVGHRENANANWRRAAEVGRPYGAPAANLASERLAYLELNCPTTATSLSRIAAPAGDARPLVARQIRVSDRKSALKVLGFYQGEINETPDWPMREAVLRFQSTLWFSPSGALRPKQVTLLICGAAQRGLDADMQDLLGLMFATGQGVVQNTDSALYWFDKAAEQGDPEAHYHLAVMYGTGFVRSANGLCGTTAILERADNYLRMAAALGHKGSVQFLTQYDTDQYTLQERWRQISADLGYSSTPPSDSCR